MFIHMNITAAVHQSNKTLQKHGYDTRRKRKNDLQWRKKRITKSKSTRNRNRITLKQIKILNQKVFVIKQRIGKVKNLKRYFEVSLTTGDPLPFFCFSSSCVWGAVSKNIASDRFSTKTAISAHIQLSLRRYSYICAHLAISAHV